MSNNKTYFDGAIMAYKDIADFCDEISAKEGFVEYATADKTVSIQEAQACHAAHKVAWKLMAEEARAKIETLEFMISDAEVQS